MLNELIKKKYDEKWEEITSHKMIKRKSHLKARPIFDKVSEEFATITNEVRFPKFREAVGYNQIEFERPTIYLNNYSNSDTEYCIDIEWGTTIIRLDVDALKSNFNAGMEWLADFLAELELNVGTRSYVEMVNRYHNTRFHYPIVDGIDKTCIM
jgi:hypothetical protein